MIRAVTLGAGLWALTAAGCGKGAPQGLSAAASASAPAPAQASATQPSSDPVAQVVVKYLAADDCGDRVQFIQNPEKNAEILKQHYKDQKTCKREYQTLDASDCQKARDDRCSVKVVFGKKPGAFGREYDDVSWYCINLKPTPKIDWRCSTGYNPLALKTFKALHEVDKPSRFRVYTELSDTYYFEYRAAKAKMYSIRITDERGESIAGYVPKDAALGKQLFELLKDGESHAVVLELTYARESQNAGAVAITNMLGTRWREYPEELR